MKIDTIKLDVVLAKRCMSMSDLKSAVSPQTLKRVRRGEDLLPKTVGKIARAVDVDVSEIVAEVTANGRV